MKRNTNSARTYGLCVLHEMHTGLFKAALDSISDKDAHQRSGTKANHIAWLTGSLVQQRYEIANMLSEKNDKQAADALFSNNQGIKDNETYPSLQSFKNDWDNISPVFTDAVSNATDADLDKVIPMGNMSMSMYELLSFVTYREANCIGQIALWRRLLGYDAMKYM